MAIKYTQKQLDVLAFNLFTFPAPKEATLPIHPLLEVAKAICLSPSGCPGMAAVAWANTMAPSPQTEPEARTFAIASLPPWKLFLQMQAAPLDTGRQMYHQNHGDLQLE